MKQTYVVLSRFLGASTTERYQSGPWEMIFPIRNENGTFRAPAKIRHYMAGFAFKKYLNEGEIILVNPKGGWNTLSKTDIIVSMYEK